MDGRAVAHELKAFSAAPIIMITAFAQVDDELTGLATGASAYLAKPFRPAESCED